MINLDFLSSTEIAQGYYQDEGGAWVCAVCAARFEQGEVFPLGGRFFDAARAVQLHVEQEHPHLLDGLLGSGSKYLQLTENQRALLAAFGGGFGDKEVASMLGVAAATVRSQRFAFREKAKAAKLYLAVWQLAQQGRQSSNSGSELLPVHGGATMVDERFVITQEEQQKIIDAVFESTQPLRLKVFPAKEKKKLVVLRELVKQFEPGRQYTEKEVNAILAEVFHDFATLRRYLIEYGYMERTRDCASYWLR